MASPVAVQVPAPRRYRETRYRLFETQPDLLTIRQSVKALTHVKAA